MILSRVKSAALVIIGVIVGSSIVLLFHWVNRPYIADSTASIISPIFSTIDNVTSIESTLNPTIISQHTHIVSSRAKHTKLPHEETLTALPQHLPHHTTCHGISFQPSVSNLFLYHAICNVSSGNEIAQFSGPTISNVFDVKRTKLHYTINQKLSTWSQVARELNQTHQLGLNRSITYKAVHMHNHHKLGDFMLLFWTEYFRYGPSGKALKTGGKGVPLTAAQFAWAMDKHQPPVVITNWGDENWGHLSGRKL